MIEMQQSDKRSLRRYLLGEATPEEQNMIEQRLLTEQEYFDELIKVEEELTDEYVRGELPDAEKKDFERHFVVNPERQDRVQFARTLNQYLSRHASSVAEAGDHGRREQPAWWGGLTPRWRAVAGLAACFLLLLAAGSVLLWRQTLYLQNQVQQVELRRTEAEQHQQELLRQIEQQVAQNSTLMLQFERQKDELNQLRRELARLLPSIHTPAESSVASLFLTPGIIRAPEQAGTAVLSSSIQKLRLNLEVGGARYKDYRAELQTVEGDVVLSLSGLKSHDTGRNKIVTLLLPTAPLTRSDYLIMLDGVSQNGASEKIATYYFKVVRKP